MLRVWIATLLNFFFPGAGYLVNGRRKLLSPLWFLGAVGLTYVELSLQTQAPPLYWPMFISVFLMNTAFAVDAFQEGKALHAGGDQAGQPTPPP